MNGENFSKKFEDLYKILLPTAAFLMMTSLTSTYYFFSICNSNPQILEGNETCSIIGKLMLDFSKMFFVEIPFIGLSMGFYMASFISTKIMEFFRVLATVCLYVSILFLITPYLTYMDQLIIIFFRPESWIAIILAVMTYRHLKK
jgi:hypothetical protein